VKEKKDILKHLHQNIKNSNSKGMLNLHISKGIEQGPCHQKNIQFFKHKIKIITHLNWYVFHALSLISEQFTHNYFSLKGAIRLEYHEVFWNFGPFPNIRI
jgi:hypothetical protein